MSQVDFLLSHLHLYQSHSIQLYQDVFFFHSFWVLFSNCWPLNSAAAHLAISVVFKLIANIKPKINKRIISHFQKSWELKLSLKISIKLAYIKCYLFLFFSFHLEGHVCDQAKLPSDWNFSGIVGLYFEPCWIFNNANL